MSALTPSEKLVIVRERQAKALAKALETVRKAEERLAKAHERLARIEAESPHKVRLAELTVEMAQHREALRRLRPAPEPTENAEEAIARKHTPRATVTTETGEARPLSREAVEVVKAILGRKRRGTFSPLDGEPAQTLLKALDESGNVGDTFTLTLKGRKSPIRFNVSEEGLVFDSPSV
jgi:hypothetical protein